MKFLKAVLKSANCFARIFRSFWISAAFSGISAPRSERAGGWREFRTAASPQPRQHPLRQRPTGPIVMEAGEPKLEEGPQAQVAVVRQPEAPVPEAVDREAALAMLTPVAAVQVQAVRVPVVAVQVQAATDTEFSGLCRSNLARFPWRKPGEMPC